MDRDRETVSQGATQSGGRQPSPGWMRARARNPLRTEQCLRTACRPATPVLRNSLEGPWSLRIRTSFLLPVVKRDHCLQTKTRSVRIDKCRFLCVRVGKTTGSNVAQQPTELSNSALYPERLGTAAAATAIDGGSGARKGTCTERYRLYDHWIK